MKPPFDIAADLDTPVSAYLKLAALQPRFLLESVEGGERLARYSFLGHSGVTGVLIVSVGCNLPPNVFLSFSTNEGHYLVSLNSAVRLRVRLRVLEEK